MNHFERERTELEAEQCFLNVLNQFQLDFELHKVGNPPLQTTTCTLFCKETKKQIEKGWGKGFGKQSELSAKFEALEFFTGQAGNVSSPCELFSLEEIHSLNIPIIPSSLLPEFVSEEYPAKNVQIPWIAYTHYKTGEQAFVPAICTHPFYSYSPFQEDKFNYSNLYLSQTTNGIASGCSRTEAMLHAIQENIERHSISLFFIETFLKETPVIPKIIDIATLHFHTQQIAHNVMEETGYQVLIFQMPNELDIPAYGALLYHPELKYPIKGFGASLSHTYAIERALLEVLESYHDGENPVEKALDKLAKWPALQKCVLFDLPKLIETHQIKLSPFIETAVELKTPKKRLDYILQKLQAENFNLYFHEIYSTTNFSTVRVVIPEAEDFFGIDKGLITPLKARGKAALLNDKG